MTAEESRPWQGAADVNLDADGNILAGPHHDGQGLKSQTHVLADRHRAPLETARIPVEFALRLGVRSALSSLDLPSELRWAGAAGAIPGLLFPWRGPDGSSDWQLRPDEPVQLDGDE